MSVNFYENVDDGLLKFAVIMTKTNGKWVFCKHKLRDTWEVPGGHREPNENIIFPMRDRRNGEVFLPLAPKARDICPAATFRVLMSRQKHA